jgi:hypothetical protein
VDWINQAQDKDTWPILLNTAMTLPCSGSLISFNPLVSSVFSTVQLLDIVVYCEFLTGLLHKTLIKSVPFRKSKN